MFRAHKAVEEETRTVNHSKCTMELEDKVRTAIFISTLRYWLSSTLRRANMSVPEEMTRKNETVSLMKVDSLDHVKERLWPPEVA